MDYLLKHWHEWAYGLLALVFIIVYIIHFLPGAKDSKLKQLIQTESILILVLIFVAIIATRVESVVTHVDIQAKEATDTLERLIQGEGYAKVQKISSLELLFQNLNDALERSEEEVRIVRFREKTALNIQAHSQQAKLFYSKITDWLDDKPGRALYTIIGTPDQEMTNRFEDLCRESEGKGNQVIGALKEELSAPRMNFVVFDKREAFLVAHTSKSLVQTSDSYHIQDENFARFLRRFHYDLLNRSVPCPE